ncbi:hypothetical protein SAZ11_33025 [Streptomyces sp. FXJ1.4098]|uniref:hypothetical protein n=1 Tax=Streptomyces sp. NPDC020845 TaxID=3365096 RepID=UPI002995EB81|nr:hypothetical protein [Streptomyces sp. FXJ1.4098]
MTEDVWPIRSGELKHLGSLSGIGFGLKGFTRADESGRCFATRWFMFIYLPVIPRQRYYLTEGEVTHEVSRITTRYALHGQSHLRAGEILRTYAFGWLVCPVVLGVPLLPLLAYANQDAPSLWVMVGGFLGCVVASSAVLALLHTTYRKRLAPLRHARWIAERPG